MEETQLNKLIDCKYDISDEEIDEIIYYRKMYNKPSSNEELYSGHMSYTDKYLITRMRINHTLDFICNNANVNDREKIFDSVCESYDCPSKIFIHKTINGEFLNFYMISKEEHSLIDSLFNLNYDKNAKTYSMEFVDAICDEVLATHKNCNMKSYVICEMTALMVILEKFRQS
jgi:hypothetical protein